MDRSFVQDNARERQRLRNLVGNLTDEQLSRPIGVDWTIAIALAHLAFWDQRSLVLMRKWKKNGIVEPSPIDIDITNEALLPLWSSLEPRKAANLAVTCAESADREAEETSPEITEQIEKHGVSTRLCRYIHRKIHLDQIEEFLQKRA